MKIIKLYLSTLTVLIFYTNVCICEIHLVTDPLNAINNNVKKSANQKKLSESLYESILELNGMSYFEKITDFHRIENILIENNHFLFKKLIKDSLYYKSNIISSLINMHKEIESNESNNPETKIFITANSIFVDFRLEYLNNYIEEVEKIELNHLLDKNYIILALINNAMIEYIDKNINHHSILIRLCKFQLSLLKHLNTSISRYIIDCLIINLVSNNQFSAIDTIRDVLVGNENTLNYPVEIHFLDQIINSYYYRNDTISIIKTLEKYCIHRKCNLTNYKYFSILSDLYQLYHQDKKSNILLLKCIESTANISIQQISYQKINMNYFKNRNYKWIIDNYNKLYEKYNTETNIIVSLSFIQVQQYDNAKEILESILASETNNANILNENIPKCLYLLIKITYFIDDVELNQYYTEKINSKYGDTIYFVKSRHYIINNNE